MTLDEKTREVAEALILTRAVLEALIDYKRQEVGFGRSEADYNLEAAFSIVLSCIPEAIDKERSGVLRMNASCSCACISSIPVI